MGPVRNPGNEDPGTKTPPGSPSSSKAAGGVPVLGHGFQLSPGAHFPRGQPGLRRSSQGGRNTWPKLAKTGGQHQGNPQGRNGCWRVAKRLDSARGRSVFGGFAKAIRAGGPFPGRTTTEAGLPFHPCGPMVGNSRPWGRNSRGGGSRHTRRGINAAGGFRRLFQDSGPRCASDPACTFLFFQPQEADLQRKAKGPDWSGPKRRAAQAPRGRKHRGTGAWGFEGGQRHGTPGGEISGWGPGSQTPRVGCTLPSGGFRPATPLGRPSTRGGQALFTRETLSQAGAGSLVGWSKEPALWAGFGCAALALPRSPASSMPEGRGGPSVPP